MFVQLFDFIIPPKNFGQQVKPKKVFLPNGNNKSTFQPEGAAPAASSLKSSYIKNEEKLSKERGTLNSPAHPILNS